MTKTPLFAFALALLLPALPAAAQEAEDQSGLKEKNSPYCGYTFFTNGPDRLEFRGAEERGCFDLKGGDDVLILNREHYAAGVEVHTGSGADTVWTTDGPDLVRDHDGRDREIRTYAGDDRIEISLPIEEDPKRGIERLERTILRPGTGTNTIEIGRDIPSTAMARQSPDIWLTSSPDAVDHVKATCGRPLYAGDFDIRALEVPPTSKLTVESFGCNIGLFGVYGDAEFDQTGGRLALQTYNEGFRVTPAEGEPKISGEIVGGQALMLDLDRSHPETSLTWEGAGSAFLRARTLGPQSGGSFHIRSARETHFQGEVPVGAVHFDLAARGRILLDMTASSRATQARFSLAAGRMDISWRLAGEGGFPVIINDEPVTYFETTFIEPEIDYRAPRTRTALADLAASVKDPDMPVNAEIIPDIPDTEVVRREVTLTPGRTNLRLQLRRDNDRFARCVSVRVLDQSGNRPPRTASCRGRQTALERLVVDRAAGYDLIEVQGDGLDMEIPINAASRFKVDRIEVDL